MVPFFLFLALKCKYSTTLLLLQLIQFTHLFTFLVFIVITHYYIYSPLKYKDDGRDVVSFIDFITIHGTFPSINAWISYNLYYYLTITVTTICDTDYFDNVTSDYCQDYKASDKRS